MQTKIIKYNIYSRGTGVRRFVKVDIKITYYKKPITRNTVTATWIQRTGDGVCTTTASSLAWTICHLHQVHFFKSSDATAGQTVTQGSAAAKSMNWPAPLPVVSVGVVTCTNSPVISLEDVTEEY